MTCKISSQQVRRRPPPLRRPQPPPPLGELPRADAGGPGGGHPGGPGGGHGGNGKDLGGGKPESEVREGKNSFRAINAHFKILIQESNVLECRDLLIKNDRIPNML